MPLGVKEIERIVDATHEEEIHNGLTPDEVMDSVGTQHKMQTLLELINDFHRKMREVSTEMNDGVSRLNSYIGLTRKFK
jgi:hypothetical protein